MTLTLMQKRYIWLAGSYPDRVVEQGQGKRSKELYYALDDEDEGRLVIFGYSHPLYFMEGKLFRKLQDGRSWALTEAGDKEFQKLLLEGFGDKPGIVKAKIKK